MKQKFADFVKDRTGAEVSSLPEIELRKLAKFVLSAMALETPRMAQIMASKLGIEL